MAKKNESQQDDNQEKRPGPEMNWRGWVYRGVLLSVLVFAFVAWRLYPLQGNMAFLWATILGGSILGWLGVSYYFLNR